MRRRGASYQDVLGDREKNDYYSRFYQPYSHKTLDSRKDVYDWKYGTRPYRSSANEGLAFSDLVRETGH